MNAGGQCIRTVGIAGAGEAVRAAAQRMRAWRIGDVAVVAASNRRNLPVGIVSDRELVCAVLAESHVEC